MRILQINEYSTNVGGAENHFQSLCRLLEKKGYEIVRFSPMDIYPSSDLRHVLSELEKTIINFSPDLVHIHVLDHRFLKIFSKIDNYNIPILQTIHDHRHICLNGSLFSKGKVCEKCLGDNHYYAGINGCVNALLSISVFAERKLFRRNPFANVNLFVTPSIYLKKKLIKWGFKGRTEHLYNFIEDFEDLSVPEKEYGTILFAGRLSPLKGVDMLLDAVRDLPCKLIVVGEGSESSLVKKYSETMPEGKIQIKGRLEGSKYREALRKATLIVVPSICPENSPLVIGEAFKEGIPVIGSNLGGIPELLGDGERGLCFESGNKLDLKEKILFLMNEPQLMQMMGEKARSFADENFRPDKYLEKIIEFYSEIINKKTSEKKS